MQLVISGESFVGFASHSTVHVFCSSLYRTVKVANFESGSTGTVIDLQSSSVNAATMIGAMNARKINR